MSVARVAACSFLVPCLIGLFLGCSSTSEPQQPPPMYIGGSPGNGGSGGGNASGGGEGTAGTSGSSGSAGSGGSGGSMCAEQCPTGGFCMAGECKCPANKPDVCDATCVSLQQDAEHCGNCMTSCDPGAACVMGACGAAPVELTKGSGCGVMRLAIVGTDLYWTEADTGAVRTMPIGGGSPTDVATGQLKPLSIAADAGGIYWSNEGDGTAGSSTVMKKALPLAADPPVLLATGTATDPDSPVIKAIAVADSMLYYTLVHDVHAISTDEAVTGDIIVGTATNLDLPDADKSAGFPSGLAVDGTYVVWTTGERSAVERDDLLEGGDGYLELGESQGDMVWADVASDGTSAYWATAANIMKSPLVKAAVGEGVEAVATTPDFGAITAFTIDAINVYFANDGGVFMAPLAGGDPVAIARDQAAPTALLVSGSTLFIATSDCAIRSLALQ